MDISSKVSSVGCWSSSRFVGVGVEEDGSMVCCFCSMDAGFAVRMEGSNSLVLSSVLGIFSASLFYKDCFSFDAN